MGMAASQARLLSITSRMSDNELKAQIINNSKMRLASESSRVSDEYIQALNSATMMISNYDESGNSQYQKLSFNSLTSFSRYNNQYGLVDLNGRLLVSEDEASMFKSADGDLDKYLEAHGLTKRTTYFDNLDIESLVITAPQTRTTDYIVKEYSKDKLIEYYEHMGVNLQSSEYEEYVYLNELYTLRKSLLEGAITGKIQEDFIDSPFSYNSTNTGSEDFGDYVKRLLTTDASNANSKTAYTAICDMVKNFVNLGYITTDSDLYKNIINKITFNSNNGITFTGEEKIVSSGDNYKFGATDASGSHYMYIAEKQSDDTYTIKVNDEDSAIKDYLDNADLGVKIEFSKDGSSYSNKLTGITEEQLKSLSFNIKETKNTGKNDNDSYIRTEEVTSYKFDLQNKKLSKSIDVNDNSAIAGYISQLYEYFLYNYVNAIMSKYAEKSTDVDIINKNNDLSDAKKKLIEFIFNPDAASQIKNSDELFNEISPHLDDIQWLLSKEKNPQFYNKLSTDFGVVEEIFVLDTLFNTYGEPTEGWLDESNNPAEAKVTWYTNMFERMQKGYKVLEDGLASSNEWIQFALESGLVTMEQVNSTNEWISTLHTNISTITEITDDVAVAKAEAEYKKAMNNIENKDKRYDIELKNIDTEHNSLQKEYESVKKVIDQNIQRTFKIYS